ncbi:MAG: HNH endonuclease [Chrysiogenetes bacterium]|nr:HNH endonuclease [Chrysiogenetes bacterium]
MGATYHAEPPPKRRPWTRDELLVVLDFYCRTPFGKLHQHNPDIIALAALVGRTPSSVAMKGCNFASLDPQHQRRGRSGLKGAAKADRALFEEFILPARWTDLLVEVSAARARLQAQAPDQGTMVAEEQAAYFAERDTEATREVKTRLVQRFFRDAVLGSYDNECAFCSLPNGKLLVASHIVPWAHDENRRADPRNGLALCALHDKAFDRGLMSVGEDFRILVSEQLLQTKTDSELHHVAFCHIAGAEMNQPSRFAPDSEALAHHRQEIFIPG